MNEAQSATRSEKITDLAEQDFDFVLRLRHLGESQVSDPAIWGELILKHYDVQSVRRSYVRLFVSLVESVIATMRSDLLEEFEGDLTASELALLQETAYDLNDQGKPVERPLFLSIQKNLRFVFGFYAYAYGVDASLNYSDDGWAAFQEAVKLRNRLTHPKRVEEMVASDVEMARVDKAYDWFIATYRGLIQAHIAKLQARLDQERP